MQSISAEFLSHIGEEVTTLALCWKIMRRDGYALGYTTSDRNLDVGGLTYRSMPGFSATAVSANNTFAGNELEIDGAISDDLITEEDLRAGLYDFANMEIFLVNWRDPELGKLILRSGHISDIRYQDGSFTAELQGASYRLDQTFGVTCSAECRAEFGDSQCKVDRSDFAEVHLVDSVVHAKKFGTSGLDKPDGWLDYGQLRWISGANAGLEAEIKRYQNGQIEIYEAMSDVVSVGDLVELTPGCDKRFVTCRTKYNNAINFRGEPHVPGSDAVFSYPGL